MELLLSVTVAPPVGAALVKVNGAEEPVWLTKVGSVSAAHARSSLVWGEGRPSRGEFAGRLQIVKRGSIPARRRSAPPSAVRFVRVGRAPRARAAPFQRSRFSAARHEPLPADRTRNPEAPSKRCPL